MNIKVENISVRVGAKRLLDNVSFEARTGEIVAVLGANGAGKSTLLRTLAGETKPSGGAFFFAEKNLDEWKTEELAKLRAVLPQSFRLDFPFKAYEVALLGRTPHIKFKETRRDYEIVGEALKITESAELADRFYPTLSGGERQRVQLARILAQIWEKNKSGEARFLLLDEPTASLDPAHQHLTLQTARKFAAEETIVVTVLHDVNLAAQYADKILFLKNGEKIAFDTPSKVLTKEIMRKVFGIEIELMKHPKSNVPFIVPLGISGENSAALSAEV